MLSFRNVNYYFKKMIRKKEIKVSVIIPVYNTGKYLERCLNSVINQTLKEIEIIIVNDGSIDDSSSIIGKFLGDSRVIYVKQNNKGQSIARNKGLVLARGDYVGFIDSDDYVDFDFFEKLYNAASQNGADIAASSIVRKHKTYEKWRVNYEKTRVITDKNDIFKTAKCPNQSYIWNKIYKKSFLDLIDFKFIENVYYEDVPAVSYLLLHCSKFCAVTGTNYYYMVNDGKSAVKGKQTPKKEFDRYNNQKKTILSLIKNDIKLFKRDYFVKKKEYRIFNFPLLKIKENLKEKREIFLLFNIVPVCYIKQESISALKIILKRLFSITRVDSHILIYFLFFRLNIKYKTEVSLPLISEYSLNKEKREKKIIASLTTFPERINMAASTVKTIMNQTVKADEIVLYLAREQFKDGVGSLPTELLKLRDFGLQIKWCSDIKSYKKIIPALKEYENDIIITFDDDVYYEEDTIETLYNSYLENPDCIQANRIWRVKRDKNSVKPLDKSLLLWNEKEYRTPSLFNTIIGCGGVLYPPGSLAKEVLNEEKFKKIIFYQDDIWLWGMAVLAKTKIRLNKGYKSDIITVENSQNSGLCKINNRKNKGITGKDGFAVMVENYPEIIEILKQEN